jgi:ParB family chromosome partitioning protein
MSARNPFRDIAGLADNIAAKGLLQNLVIHFIKGSRSKQPKLGVCAGQRRLAALDLLLQGRKRIHRRLSGPRAHRQRSRRIRRFELIENSQRENLDPFSTVLRAKRMLADEGRSIDYIAALFSAAPIT